MNSATPERPRWVAAVAVLLGLFGVLTVFSGGRALFGSAEAQVAAGNAVPYVLWFNFVAGFFYVIAAFGIFRWQRWAARLSVGIALATTLVFAAFGWHVASGGAFEMRTVIAMLLRIGIWVVLAAAACRALGCFNGRNKTA